jgi:hypothetical protein
LVWLLKKTVTKFLNVFWGLVWGISMTAKGRLRWMVNVASFILFSLLTLTGLINWLLLPRGRVSGRGLVISARHFLIGVHEWTAILFIAAIAVHIGLHWKYVKSNLRGMPVGE